MRKAILSTLIIVCAVNTMFGAILNVKKNRIARVGDRIINRDEVERASAASRVSFDHALESLINFEVLYLASRIYITPPEDEVLLEEIANEKDYYAQHFRKESSEISDIEFLNSIGFKNQTMKQYLEYLRKRMMVDEYLNSLYKMAELKNNTISKEEIDKYIKENPKKFMYGDRYEVMLIYFSYFDKDGKQLPDSIIKEKYDNSKKCLKELKEGLSFSLAVDRYSEDKYTLNQEMKGYYGIVDVTDEYTKNRFTSDILEAFSKQKVGLIPKVLGTSDGVFIFKLLSHMRPEKLPYEQMSLMASETLKRRNITKAKKEVEEKTIQEFKKKFEIILY